MILPQDSLKLALTKLKVRKVRTFITLFIGSLLFGILIFASLVFHGIFSSIEDFSKEGLGSRYIIQAYLMDNPTFIADNTVYDRANQINKDIIAQKKAAAKKLGIDYDPKSEPSPVSEYDGPGGKIENLNFQHPAAIQAMNEYLKDHPKPGLDELKKLASSYQPVDYYQSQMFQYASHGESMQVLKEGKEKFETQSTAFNPMGPPMGQPDSDPIATFYQQWNSVSVGLLEPFLLPNQNLQIGLDGSIPLIIPYNAAENLLKLKALSSSATTEDQLNRVKQVRELTPSLKFDLCYRNDSSVALINQAISTQQEIERNKKNKDYIKPDLIYGLPTEACGTSPIIRDVRSKATKTLQDKQTQFDQMFGKKPPEQQLLHFRVVGVSPSVPSFNASNVQQMIYSLVGYSLGSGYYTPEKAIEKNPLLSELFTNTFNQYGMPLTRYVELPTSDLARHFMEEKNCNFDPTVSDPYKACQKAGKIFSLMPYGSNSIGMEMVKQAFAKYFLYALLAVGLIACLILSSSVGRMIIDSRRETAIFRAIGAKRIDISQIYLLYVLILALIVSVISLAVGIGAALILNYFFADQATIASLVTFNVSDLTKRFYLYGINSPELGKIIGVLFVASIISSIFPLLRNIRRNPINDMRDDT